MVRPALATTHRRVGSPRLAAVARGTSTRSSLHSGATSTAHVCRTLAVPAFSLCVTSCCERLVRVIAYCETNWTRRSACCRVPKKKSMPPFTGLISTASRAAPFARISCSSRWSTRACATPFCRSCTHADHDCLAAARSHSRHCPPRRTYSTTHCCCSAMPPTTSARTVTFTLSLLECGSVQTKPASISLRRCDSSPSAM
mmetsp:Transcript_25075/g.64787  ORF Transcript_25075/g.64787 Transcript_25075/m.64787 type:complete len:200 (-) Transcript_25075:333-932(-)